MKRHLSNVKVACRLAFAHPSYSALAGVLAILAFLLAVWFPNFRLIAEVFADSSASLRAKLGFALSLLGGIATNFSPLSGAYTTAIAVLFGIDTALVIYLAKQARTGAGGNMVLGAGGIATGIVGVGCAACGSLIVGGLLPSFGVAAALAALPLKGEEFGILSVGLLLVSLLFISKTIARPSACKMRGAEP